MATEFAIDPANTTRQQVERRRNLAEKVLAEIRRENIYEPRTGPTFTVAQAAELVNRSPSAIRMAESEGRLPQQKRNAQGRRENYTIAQLNHMREVFGTRPWRNPSDEPVILPVQNFKGGVGKSTVSFHLAQYLAIKGYRVLLIDADAQASTTMMFGYIPDVDLEMDDNIGVCFQRGNTNYRPIKDLIRPTHYDGLDLVPANLSLYNSEYLIAARMPTFGAKVLTMLREEIATVSDNYDVVILDPPPALGMISLSALYAATALLIPMPPNIIDFASTTAFLAMLANNMEQLEERGIEANYGFIQIIISRSDEQKWAQRQIVDMTKTVFGRTVLESEIKSSAEIDNCTSRQLSVYDVNTSSTNHQVRKRCLTQLNKLNSEIEGHIRSLWPHTPAVDAG